jgi:DNA-binding NarL/FixJ family response regulator
LYSEGKNDVEIHKLYPHISLTTISSIINNKRFIDKNYIKPKRKDGRFKFSDQEILNIRKLYLNGNSIYSISMELNLIKGTVRDIVNNKIRKDVDYEIQLNKFKEN